MPKFTPGPWRATAYAGRAAVILNETITICDCGSASYSPANARLIAAAPDMYAALESITVLRTEPDGSIVIGPRGYELVRQALALAGGKEQ